MVVRFAVRGFKNLAPLDLKMRPLMCLAGPNGSGKSNLLEAFRFLSALATDNLREAFGVIRGSALALGGSGDLSFEVDFLTDRKGRDELGTGAEASATFLRYSLDLKFDPQQVKIVREVLAPVPDGRQALLEFGSREWVDSVLVESSSNPFITTTNADTDATRLHREGSGQQELRSQTSTMKRTLLSSRSQVGHHPTAFLARQSLARVALFHFEPSSLRKPDSLQEGFAEAGAIDTTGKHLPSVLLRLTREDEAAPVRVTNTLATLVAGIDSLMAKKNEATQTVEIRLRDLQGREYPAGSLSDGTLRVLALAILLHDSTAQGCLLLEEPENGVHPTQLPALLTLLRDIACGTELAVEPGNPLRQVCFTTHSPGLVGLLKLEEVRFAFRQDFNLGEVRFLPAGCGPHSFPDHHLWNFLKDHEGHAGTLGRRSEEFVRSLELPIL